MRIDEIHIKNFKNFESKIFQFNSHFTVIIGDNGTGKTAILDALAVGLGCFLLGIGEANSRLIKKEEIRLKDFGEYVEKQLPTVVSVKSSVLHYLKQLKIPYMIDPFETHQTQEISFPWFRSIEKPNGSNTSKGTSEIADLARRMADAVRNGKAIDMPLISYHGTGRLWIEKSKIKTRTKGSRLENGYRACLSPASNSKAFLEWFKTQELAVIQKKKDDTLLKVVKKAIANCVSEWDEIYFDFEDDDLKGYNTTGLKNELSFSLLSDGVRNMIGMVADIAYRCVVLNPHLGIDATEKTRGVVLIDELDLHLHPKWQRHVVNDLKRAFPKLQFIATTHSPFIVQSLKSDELVNLDKPTDENYYQQSLEEIILGTMGVNSLNSERYTKMLEVAKKYYAIIENGKSVKNKSEVAEMKQKLDKMIEPYYDNPAYVAVLQMERLAKLGM